MTPLEWTKVRLPVFSVAQNMPKLHGHFKYNLEKDESDESLDTVTDCVCGEWTS